MAAAAHHDQHQGPYRAHNQTEFPLDPSPPCSRPSAAAAATPVPSDPPLPPRAAALLTTPSRRSLRNSTRLIPNQQVRRRPAASPRQPIVLLRRTLPAATPYPASRLIQAQIMNSSTLQRTHQGMIMSSSCS